MHRFPECIYQLSCFTWQPICNNALERESHHVQNQPVPNREPGQYCNAPSCELDNYYVITAICVFLNGTLRLFIVIQAYYGAAIQQGQLKSEPLTAHRWDSAASNVSGTSVKIIVVSILASTSVLPKQYIAERDAPPPANHSPLPRFVWSLATLRHTTLCCARSA